MDSNNNIQNVQEKSGFQWWVKKRKSYYLQNLILFSVFLICSVLMILTAGVKSIGLQDVLLLGAPGLFFVFVIYKQFKLWRKCFNLCPDNCWIGTISESNPDFASTKRLPQVCSIIVNANGKSVEAVCLKQTYQLAEPDQEVLLFTLGGKTVYCVHPEM